MPRSRPITQRLHSVVLAGLSAACCVPAFAADIVVNVADDDNVESFDPYVAGSPCSLRAAMYAASVDTGIRGCTAGAGADRIVFDGVTSITLERALPAIFEPLTLDGEGRLVTVRRSPDAANQFRILRVDGDSADLTLRWIAIEGGAVGIVNPPGGGGIRSEGVVILEDSRVSGNASLDPGGGVLARELRMVRSELSDNSSYELAGGAYVEGAITLVDSRVTGNEQTRPAEDDGEGDGESSDSGGLKADSVTATRSEISGNTANAMAGIAAVTTITLIDSVVDGNTATAGGFGGLYADTVIATRSRITNNTAEGAAGIGGLSVTLVDSIVDGNTASAGSGGGVRAGDVTVTRSRISNNTARSGGGIMGLEVYLTDSFVDGNTATAALGAGGGVYANTLLATRSTISNNVGAAGGGLYADGMRLENSTVSDNHIEGSCGGGLAALFVWIENSTITGNTGGNGTTGGICIAGLDPVPAQMISNSILHGNEGDIGMWTGLDTAVEGSNNIIGNAGSSMTLPADTLDCDPQLAALADNGGFTPTHAIANDSCAFDAGTNPLALDTDQRGEPRTHGAGTDIGAFELQPSPLVFRDGFEP